MTTGPKFYSLRSVPGLTATALNALKKAGIDNTRELLDAARSATEESKLARKVGVTVSEIREAVNRADLMQVSGLGPKMADLFENAGVNSARELAKRNADSLRVMLEKFSKDHPELGSRLPNPKTLTSLIAKAKEILAPAKPVTTLDAAQARKIAGETLHKYIDEVMFSTHPEGQQFRDAVLGWRPASEWPNVQKQFHDGVDAWMNEAEVGTDDEIPGSFWMSGQLSGLYTEVKLDQTGKVLKTYVEID